MKDNLLNDKFFSRLETLSLNLKKNLRGYFGGKHLVSTYGQTVEFADYREYMLGDDIRRIDWNLFSRFGKYYLKLFTDERQMHVQIFLDCSASMGRDNPEKAAYATATAAALGFLAVHNMDKVSFNYMKGNRAENPYGMIIGKNAFYRAISNFQAIDYVDEVSILDCVRMAPDTTASNGLTVIISDFFTDEEWKKAIDYLCYKNRQVLLVQVLTPDEVDPLYEGRVNLIDSEAMDITDTKNLKLNITRGMQKAYLEAMHDFQEDIKNYCKKRGVDYISICSDTPIEKVLFGQLFKVGIMS